MNKGTYGYPLPPNAPTRVAPPAFMNNKAFMAPGAYTGEVVPQNVYQIAALVIGGGGGGGAATSSAYETSLATGGGAGAYALVMLDVVPGQTLPTITVGLVS